MFGEVGDDDGGALGHFIRAVNEVNLKLNRKKCQCYIHAETEEKRQAIAALIPPWLRRTFKITNDETKAGYNDILDKIDAAKLAVKRAKGTVDEQEAVAELQAKEQEAADYLHGVPENQRAYGIVSVGAALGDDDYVQMYLREKGDELCAEAVSYTHLRAHETS